MPSATQRVTLSRVVLTCLPQGICSRDYWIFRGDAPVAEVFFDTFRENVTLATPEGDYRVVKGPMFSGRWTLESGVDILATADKPSPFRPTFDVRAGRLVFEISRVVWYQSDLQLTIDGKVVGLIAREHWGTRRARMDIDDRVPLPLQLFAFALAALMWRRDDSTATSMP